jgi:hypothetical protein
MEALDAGIGEQNVNATEFTFTSEASRSQRRQSRWSSLIPSQRRPAIRTNRPVSSQSSWVDGSTPERGSTGAQISRPMMSAPSRAKATVVARLIPRAAPVTTATLSRSRPFGRDVGTGAV